MKRVKQLLKWIDPRFLAGIALGFFGWGMEFIFVTVFQGVDVVADLKERREKKR